MGEIPKILAKFKGATREKVRWALARVIETDELRHSTKLVSITKIRSAGGGDQNCITECLREWRAGRLSLSDSWDDGAPSAGTADEESARKAAARARLESMLADARNDGDREMILHELSIQLAAELIEPDRAKVIQQALGEARQQAEKRRQNEAPPEDPTKLARASDLGMKAARAVDLILSDERRERVLASLAAELEADAIENPNVDRGGAA